MGIRAYLLARELGIDNRELMDFLAKRGVTITNHLAALQDSDVEMLRQAYGGDAGTVRVHTDRVEEKTATKTKRKTAPATEDPRAALRARMEAARRRLGMAIPEEVEEEVAEPAAPERAEPAEAPSAEVAAAVETAEGAPVETLPEAAAPSVETPAAEPAVETSLPQGAPPAEAQPAAPEAPSVPQPASPEAPSAPPEEAPPSIAAEAAGVAAPSGTAPEAPPAEAKPAEAPAPPKKKHEPPRRVVTIRTMTAGPKPVITKPARPIAPRPSRTGGRPSPRPSGTAAGGGAMVPPGDVFGPMTSGKPGAGRRKGVGGGAGAKARRGKYRFFPSEMTHEGSPPGTFARGRAVPTARPGRRKGKDGKAAGGGAAAPPQRPTQVEVTLPITVKEFSSLTGIRVNEILRQLLLNKVPGVTANSHIDPDWVELIGAEFGVEVKIAEKRDLEAPIEDIEARVDPPESLTPRAPVVTFLGHVDHGKTSLLDRIRHTNVTDKEAGGITQRMSAYRIEKGDLRIVFLDTPGHKAFTGMRARGANVTDLAVLVVAADDGPMPQTEEAMNHARAAGVPMIVALNKIDKANANPARCREKLARIGLTSPAWGGNTEIVDVSAVTGQGIDNLLEVIHLEAQILDLKANPDRPAIGIVLDSESSGRRGIVATVLVQNGTLRVGDPVLCGCAYGPVRNMWGTTTGDALAEAGPSTPVEITGLSIVPEAGDRLYVLGDLAAARGIAEQRLARRREEERAEREHVTRETILERVARGTIQELRIVLKGDVKGTLEAIRAQLLSMTTPEVKVVVLHAGVGGVSEGDVLLADASEAVVLGFAVAPDERARSAAEEKGVDIRTYDVIYDLLDDMRRLLEDRLAPESVEEITGHAEIRQVFRASKIGSIAGCFVRDGTIARGSKVRVIRDGRVIYGGSIASLRRLKDDAREVKEGFECGIKVQDYDDIKEGDVLEAYRVIEKRRTLEIET
ncbi:MAG: translation initiation factor IF-2 [Planctomycetes bacterium]|nr:translation initiation factor IF-2 [Planctomycetota bacterium]